MQIVELTSWNNAFIFHITQFATLNTATVLLTDYLYNRVEEKLEDIWKKELQKILKKQLMFYWLQWEFWEWDFYWYVPDWVDYGMKILKIWNMM